jgi:hypothetical protein
VPLGEHLLKSFRSAVVQLGEDLFPAVFFKEAA